MKALMFAILLFIGVSVMAAPSPLPTAAEQAYLEVNGYNEMDYTDMVVSFYATEQDLKNLIAEAGACDPATHNIDYTAVDAEVALESYLTPLEQLMERMTDGEFLNYQIQTDLYRAINTGYTAVEDYLADKSVSICTVRWTPNYSNGEDATFFMVDGVLQFAVSAGYPD